MDEYEDVPLCDLEINDIRWSEGAAEHIRTRSKRVHPNEPDIEPEWATEAALDQWRRVGLPNTGPSLQVVGYSDTMGRVLKVWMTPMDMERGLWEGRSAAVVKRAHETAYWEERGGGRDDED